MKVMCYLVGMNKNANIKTDLGLAKRKTALGILAKEMYILPSGNAKCWFNKLIEIDKC